MTILEIKDADGKLCYLGDEVIYLAGGYMFRGKITKITPTTVRAGHQNQLARKFYRRDPILDPNRERPNGI